MQVLTLATMAMLRVHRISVKLENDVTAPTFTAIG